MPFKKKLRKSVIEEINYISKEESIDNSITHISAHELGRRLDSECFLDLKCEFVEASLMEGGNNTISRNLGSDYLSFINTTNDEQPGLSVQLNKALIIWGQHRRDFVQRNSDGVVTREDAEGILEAITAINESIQRVDGVNHNQLVSNAFTELSIEQNLR